MFLTVASKKLSSHISPKNSPDGYIFQILSQQQGIVEKLVGKRTIVTETIDKIMTGEDIQQQDLVISQLLTQDINKYKGTRVCSRMFQSLFEYTILIQENTLYSVKDIQIHSIRVSTETME